MKNNFDMSYLGVMADMAGCPNRCRHCWLGSHRNGDMTVSEFRGIAEQFKNWKDENGIGIKELGFFSWWREPDFRDDYRELWQVEQELSSPGRAQRFELLSIWRLARDESYPKWAATLEPKVCQITFFGMEKTTDWGIRRKGSFKDNLLATGRLLDVGIAPRWQLFITKQCLDELDDFLRLIIDLDLHKRCEAIGQKFEVFIGGMSPEGNGYEIDNLRVDENDITSIPNELISICREGASLLGQPEYALLESLMKDDKTPNVEANVPSVSVNANFDVYPNIAEPTEWWCLGNLKTDGVDTIIKAYRDETTPGMKANRELPICELAQRYGDINSKKLYHKDDLICRWLHQWGVDYMEGRL
ncbi:MAG: radical SAM protein [Oscillospiraceae bacterium]|nr:radical SAM protein [Oscillospiraceae bacterium]